MKIVTNFSIGDKVYITELKRPGRITAIYVSEGNIITYNVRYFYEGELKTTYFYYDELAATK